MKDIFIKIIFTCLLWLAISVVIQAFSCPCMTQTELFLNIPKSFIADWEKCK